MTDARSPMRALRAALFAAICAVLAAVGHSSLSGHDLPAVVVVLAFAVSGAAAWLAGTRRRGALCIGTGLLTVQGALHLLFAGADSHTAPPHDADGHPMGTGAMAADPMGPEAMEAGVTAGSVHTIGMLAAHVLGAVLCALWLAHGEAAFFRLARTIGTLAFAPLRLLLTAVRVPEPLPRPVRPRPHTRRLHGAVLTHALSRRGPPRLSFPRATAPGANV
ncbi:hypothetical protein ACFU5O_00710 [Streptomyces sp. NPDC057445]|uniref:hypothetical protein n=1 Tax=Streptomyces sp. NPDC057445 TaxID=3346136 RepID=UPI00369EB263